MKMYGAQFMPVEKVIKANYLVKEHRDNFLRDNKNEDIRKFFVGMMGKNITVENDSELVFL